MKLNFTHSKRNAMKRTLKFHLSPTRLEKQQKLQGWQACEKSGPHVFCVTGMKFDIIPLERNLAKTNRNYACVSFPFSSEVPLIKNAA